MNLFNTPYYTGHNLDKRLQLDYDINSNDTQTPFSAFSRRPLEIGSNHFFNTIFSKDQIYDDDEMMMMMMSLWLISKKREK